MCQQASRPKFQHYLSQCRYLHEEDRRFFKSKVRQTDLQEADYDSELDEEPDILPEESTINPHVMSASRRVTTKQSPHFKAFFGYHPVQLTLDTGAEISMIKTSVADYIGAVIGKSHQPALQAHGVTSFNIVGETHINLSRGNKTLKFEALVVSDLDVDILAGIAIMTVNDVSIRPAKQQIITDESTVINYGSFSDQSSCNRMRRTQAYVLRSTPCSTVVWPGNFIELDLPTNLDPDCTVALEARTDPSAASDSWSAPSILEAVNGKIHALNDTFRAAGTSSK